MSESSLPPQGSFSSKAPEVIPVPDEATEEMATVPMVRKPVRPSFWQRPGGTILLAALVAGFVATVVSVGINVISFVASKPRPGGEELLRQNGAVTIGTNQDKEVFYPIPYAGPPHLTLDADGIVHWEGLKIKEQKPDHFTLQYSSPFGGAISVRWKAEGLREKRPHP